MNLWRRKVEKTKKQAARFKHPDLAQKCCEQFAVAVECACLARISVRVWKAFGFEVNAADRHIFFVGHQIRAYQSAEDSASVNIVTSYEESTVTTAFAFVY